MSAGVLFKSFICIIMWMGVWYPWRPEEGIASPEMDVAGSCKPPCGCWESNLCSLEEQPGLSATEPSVSAVSFRAIGIGSSQTRPVGFLPN